MLGSYSSAARDFAEATAPGSNFIVSVTSSCYTLRTDALDKSLTHGHASIYCYRPQFTPRHPSLAPRREAGQDRDRDRSSLTAPGCCRPTSPRPRHACWRRPDCCRARSHTCSCIREGGRSLEPRLCGAAWARAEERRAACAHERFYVGRACGKGRNEASEPGTQRMGRGSYGRRRATCGPTSGWEHWHASASTGGVEERYLSTGSTALAPAAADESPSMLQHLRCSADAVGSTDGTSLTAGLAFQPQHAVAAASANPSTMATGQAPCGLAGDPAEQA